MNRSHECTSGTLKRFYFYHSRHTWGESSGRAGVGSPRVNAATFFLETNYLSLEMYSCDFISISELKCKLKGGVPRKNGHFGLKIIPYWCTAWYRFRAENFKYWLVLGNKPIGGVLFQSASYMEPGWAFFFFSFQVTKMRLKPFFVWRTMCEPCPTRPSMDQFTSNSAL